jgi:hypothetical protein
VATSIPICTLKMLKRKLADIVNLDGGELFCGIRFCQSYNQTVFDKSVQALKRLLHHQFLLIFRIRLACSLESVQHV